ncbi:MAG: YtxH domain-containing protein [Acidobacteria bacterium]|nr:YtxH domain-containing protein [Acidobacteriota bacterium]
MGEGSDRGSKLAYFLVGGGIGAVVALLFAPRTGRETRDIISQRTADSRERVASATRVTSGKVSDYLDKGLEKGREAVSTQRDQISAAIAAGKQAYQEEKGTSGTES